MAACLSWHIYCKFKSIFFFFLLRKKLIFIFSCSSSLFWLRINPILISLSLNSCQILQVELNHPNHIMVPLSRLTCVKIISCWIRERGSCNMLINQAISQSFSLSGASWTRQKTRAGELEARKTRCKIIKESCVSKGLVEAHQTPTRSSGWVAGGHLGGRMSGWKTERDRHSKQHRWRRWRDVVMKWLKTKSHLLTVTWELCVWCD